LDNRLLFKLFGKVPRVDKARLFSRILNSFGFKNLRVEPRAFIPKRRIQMFYTIKDLQRWVWPGDWGSSIELPESWAEQLMFSYQRSLIANRLTGKKREKTIRFYRSPNLTEPITSEASPAERLELLGISKTMAYWPEIMEPPTFTYPTPSVEIGVIVGALRTGKSSILVEGRHDAVILRLPQISEEAIRKFDQLKLSNIYRSAPSAA